MSVWRGLFTVLSLSLSSVLLFLYFGHKATYSTASKTSRERLLARRSAATLQSVPYISHTLLVTAKLAIESHPKTDMHLLMGIPISPQECCPPLPPSFVSLLHYHALHQATLQNIGHWLYRTIGLNPKRCVCALWLPMPHRCTSHQNNLCNSPQQNSYTKYRATVAIAWYCAGTLKRQIHKYCLFCVRHCSSLFVASPQEREADEARARAEETAAEVAKEEQVE